MKLSAVILGLALSAAVPAMAQTNTQQAPAGYVPLYNTSNSAPVYYAATPNGIPVYNNTNSTPTLPMEQMVAGKNAPSYNFNQQQPYGAGGTNWYTGSGAMSPQQEALAQQQYAQQQQAAAAQQQAYMNSLQPQQSVQNGGFPDVSVLNRGPFSNQQPAPIKRRVVGREMNNPLREPPRLFNPDQ